MRKVSLKDVVFASHADRNIPQSPSVGLSYRNSEITPEQAGKGMQYNSPFSSADFNEMMFRVTSLLRHIEGNAGIEWSDETRYEPNDLCRNSADNSFWRCMKENGKGTVNGVQEPSSDSEYWELARFNVAGLPTANENIVFVSGGEYHAKPGDFVCCDNIQSKIKIILPDTSLPELNVYDRISAGIVQENFSSFVHGIPYIVDSGGKNIYELRNLLCSVQFYLEEKEDGMREWKVFDDALGSNLLIMDGSTRAELKPNIAGIVSSDTIEFDDSFRNQGPIHFIAKNENGFTLTGTYGGRVGVKISESNELLHVVTGDSGLFIQDSSLRYQIPVGAIFSSFSELDPKLFLMCDGRQVCRNKYSLLFEKIGEKFGSGDGITTFAVPDLRGVYIRGHKEGESVELGAKQYAQMPSLSGFFGGAMGNGTATADGKLFVAEPVANGGTGGDDKISGRIIDFNAGKKNSIYGSNSTVMLNSLNVLYYIYVGGY